MEEGGAQCVFAFPWPPLSAESPWGTYPSDAHCWQDP